MLSFRAPLIGSGAAGGLVLGALLWFAVGKGAPAAARMDDLQARLDALRPPATMTPATIDPTNLASAPLFAMTTGPGAVTEPAVALQGVAKAPGRTAALLSIDGKPADWLAQGASRDGVTLQDVRAGSVLVDTVTGTKEIALGQKVGPAAPASAPGPASPGAPSPPSGPQAGYRLPPAPANAPGGG
ncbi:MAG TPA: hypothetical protein VF459_16615 [Caulobacteraceae bacterium]